MPILQLTSELALHTRCENQITNQIDRRPLGWMASNVMNYWKDKYPDEDHRPVGPSNAYNCHGLTFACRRTRIEESQEIAKIIKDDEYVVIKPPDRVLIGDVVVYYSADGDAAHSGIVVGFFGPFRVPVILSKWNQIHEVVHRVGNCPYADSPTITYYRIKT